MTKAYRRKKLLGLMGSEVGMHGKSSRHGNQKEKLRAHIVNHQRKTEQNRSGMKP